MEHRPMATGTTNMTNSTDYKVTARFIDGSSSIYDSIPFDVARSVYYGFVKDDDCVEVSYRLTTGVFDRYCEVGNVTKIPRERFQASAR
jgi:hypothetical protein